MALAIGLAVFGIAYTVAWRKHGRVLDRRALFTAHQLRQIRRAVDRHVEATGTAPDALPEILRADQTTRGYVGIGGVVADEWGHPLHYERRQDTYRLLSLGADGRPGGSGLDADLDAADTDRPFDPVAPTLRQFVFDLPSASIAWTCLAAGAFVFALSWVVIPAFRRPGEPARAMWVTLGITAVATVLLALFISMLHIPSGH